MNEIEIWKPVIGYEGLYDVSNLGRIRSVDRVVQQAGKISHLKGHIMAQSVDKDGYLRCSLSKNGKRKTYPVHRIVLNAFVPNPEGKPHVDHINTIRDDNRVENLRWATQTENNNNQRTIQHLKKTINNDGYQQKRLNALSKNGSPKAPKKVYQYSKNYEYINSFNSISEAARNFGINHENIVRALDNPKKRSAGYIWLSEKIGGV